MVSNVRSLFAIIAPKASRSMLVIIGSNRDE
jgi:hypothetical protein